MTIFGRALLALSLCATFAACSGGGASKQAPSGGATPSPTPAGQTPSPAPSGATPTPTPAPTPAATNGPALAVDAGASRHAISPDIYGVTIFWSSSTPSDLVAFAKAIGLPANRYGGDATTRYNWNVDSSNAGSDWYFMGGNGQSSVTPGASVDTIVDGN